MSQHGRTLGAALAALALAALAPAASAQQPACQPGTPGCAIPPQVPPPAARPAPGAGQPACQPGTPGCPVPPQAPPPAAQPAPYGYGQAPAAQPAPGYGYGQAPAAQPAPGYGYGQAPAAQPAPGYGYGQAPAAQPASTAYADDPGWNPVARVVVESLVGLAGSYLTYIGGVWLGAATTQSLTGALLFGSFATTFGTPALVALVGSAAGVGGAYGWSVLGASVGYWSALGAAFEDLVVTDGEMAVTLFLNAFGAVFGWEWYAVPDRPRQGPVASMRLTPWIDVSGERRGGGLVLSGTL